MWFEYDKLPLKWDVPIGVQFDTIVGFGESKSKDLPWQLVFNYTSSHLCSNETKLVKNGPIVGVKYINQPYRESRPYLASLLPPPNAGLAGRARLTKTWGNPPLRGNYPTARLTSLQALVMP